jgi:hypothetical protein
MGCNYFGDFIESPCLMTCHPGISIIPLAFEASAS